MTTDVVTCRHCDRRIVNEAGRWIDPEAPATPDEGDDYIWRETCDAHDTFTAEHEPSNTDLRPLGDVTMTTLEHGDEIFPRRCPSFSPRNLGSVHCELEDDHDGRHSGFDQRANEHVSWTGENSAGDSR